MSVTGTIHLPNMEPEWREGVAWTPYRSLRPHPWDALVSAVGWSPPDDEASEEPEHVLLEGGYCAECGGCCLIGFGNPA